MKLKLRSTASPALCARRRPTAAAPAPAPVQFNWMRPCPQSTVQSPAAPLPAAVGSPCLGMAITMRTSRMTSTMMTMAASTEAATWRGRSGWQRLEHGTGGGEGCTATLTLSCNVFRGCKRQQKHFQLQQLPSFPACLRLLCRFPY